MPPPVPYDGPSPPPSNGYENSNNIPINNYNSNGPGPSNSPHPQDYYDEGQPNEIYSAASTNSKTTEKLAKEKKK